MRLHGRRDPLRAGDAEARAQAAPDDDGLEIEHFFQRYKDLEPTKRTETRGWGNRAEAADILAAARDRAG